MSPNGWLNLAGAWVLTYLAHSTLLLGAVVGAAKWVGRRSLASEEALWRGALLGALLTATLQLGLGWHPLSATWRLSVERPREEAVGAAEATTEARWVAPQVEPAVLPAHASHLEPTAVLRRPLTTSLQSQPREPRIVRPGAWLSVACFAYLACAAFLALSVVRAHLWLRRRLRTRSRVVEAHVVSQLAQLTAAAGFAESVRLSCSSRLPVPVALGVQRAEICVPPRALFLLSDEEQEGLIAHELAHVVRRDLRWMMVTTLLTRVLFFQPLNWIASRRLREISELIADQWAVTRTGRPQSLARCLTEVAGWSYSLLRPLPVPGAARAGSQLQRRVRRLLEAQPSGTGPLRPAAVATLSLIAVAVMVLAAPSFGADREDGPGAAPAAPAVAASAPAAPASATAPVIAESVDDALPADSSPALAPLPALPAEPLAPTPALAPLPPVPPLAALAFDDAEDDEEVAEDEARLAKAEAELAATEGRTDRDRGDIEKAAREIERASERLTQNLDRELAALGPRMEILQRQLIDLNSDRFAGQGLAMDKLNAELGQLQLGLSEAEAEKLSRSISQSVSGASPEISKELAAKVKAQMDQASEAIKRYTELSSRDWIKSYQKEIERLRAAQKLDVDKIRDQMRQSEDERRKIVDEARRLAEASRPTAEQLQAIRKLAHDQAEMVRRSVSENRALIEATRRAIEQQMTLLRDENRREMDRARRQRDLDRRDRRLDRAPAPPEAPSPPAEAAPPSPPSLPPPPPQ